MYKKLLSLEKSLFNLAYISDRKWLSAIIHDDYEECGKSGTLFNKDDVISALLSCESDRDITIYNFKFRELNKHCWIVNYITESENNLYYRTSVWTEGSHIQLRFHQASKLSGSVDLTKC